MFFFLCLVSLGCLTVLPAVAGTEAEMCVTHQIRNKATNQLVDKRIRCYHGCCGVYPSQTCCAFNIGLLVGGLFGGIAALALIAVLVCCCVKKLSNNQASVEPEAAAEYHIPHRPRTPHHTNINVLYAGGGPYAHYNPTFGWMFPVRRPVTPISPPPYLDRDTPPPPYSRSHPRVDQPRHSVFTLPGCLDDNGPPEPNPPAYHHPQPHPGVSAVTSSPRSHSTDRRSSSSGGGGGGSESDSAESSIHHASMSSDVGHSAELSDISH